jgi:GTP cyclohydrolase I
MDAIDSNAQAIEYSIKDILSYLGEDPNREGLIDTPKRVRKSWDKLYGGYKLTAEQILGTSFDEFGDYDEMVLLKDIDFFSTCEHHMLPFMGKVHVAYIPNKKVVGISKLARLVEMHARRLQIQERMTADIANDIERILEPLGVAVLVEGQHYCIKARGIEKINSIMSTSKLTGVFKTNSMARSEFLTLSKGRN